MMKKRVAIYLSVILFLVAILPVSHATASEILNAQFYNGNKEAKTNNISVNFRIVNTGTTELDLSDLSMKYFFTSDGPQAVNFTCDYSPIGNNNVVGTFEKVSINTSTDTVLTVGFTTDAGTLKVGQSVDVYGRIHKEDWSMFTQTNDFSFNDTDSSFNNIGKISVYIGDTLVAGSTPDLTSPSPTTEVTPTLMPTQTPTVTPTTTPTPTVTPTITPTIRPTPTVAPPDSIYSNVQLIGRFDTSDVAGPKFAWSNSTIKANFTGTGISVNLKSVGDNYFNVIIDGIVKAPIRVSQNTTSPITLATGLTNGVHTIELVKRTEANVGEVQFLGFTVTDGELLTPPEASSKRIMFIGDSITCGYGNEGTSQYESFTTKNENAYLTYAAITARALGADLMNISWSGRGVYSNYGGDKTDLMPEIFERILPYNPTLLWDYTKWTPQVIVINLCTNDFSTGTPDTTAFTTAYKNFVGKIRSQYPNADIYCAVGPMLSWDALTNARNCITSTVSLLEAAGDSKIHFIEFPTQDAANGYGEDWHPSLATHEIMADQLITRLQDDLGW